MRDIGDRWLGVGLATTLGIATLVLTATDRLSLYVNPSTSWFAVAMAVVAVGVGIVGLALPRGAENDHGHDHGHVHGHDAPSLSVDGASAPDEAVAPSGAANRSSVASLAAVSGGSLASVVVIAAWALPATTLSVDIAINRSSDTPALFRTEETVALARSGDTSLFGIPEWSTVFASTTSPETFRGDTIDLVGFVMEDPEAPGQFLLTRLVITHCAIDAQPAHIPVSQPGWDAELSVGDWVNVSGRITHTDGALVVEPSAVTIVDKPDDRYEY